MTAPGARLPDVLIGGVPKAGTSTLARWLGAHPEVFLPPDKEVHYFDERPDARVAWYRRQFDGPGRVAVDATPTYALREETLGAAAAVVPDARLVLLLRHPVERLRSAYWYLRSMGLEARRLDQVVEEEMGDPTHASTRLRAGDYRALLERVDRYWPRSQTLVLLQDDLADRPDEVWQRACAFLGLAPMPRPQHVGERLNPTETLRSFTVRHWSMRMRLFRRTPRLAHAVDRWNRTDRPPPAVPADLRGRLLEHYEPSVEAVEARLRRSLPAWRR